MTKYAGKPVRDTRISRVTGLEVQVVDAQHPDSPIGPDEPAADWDATTPRWATYCPEHGNYCWHETWRTATSFLGEPEAWCEDCAALVEREGPVQTGPGFSAEERARAQAARSENAAKRQAERDRAKAARQDAAKKKDLWAEWIRQQPMLPGEWTEEEREEVERLRLLQVAAQGERGKARERLRDVDRKLNRTPPPKPKEEKALEAERSTYEAQEQAAAEEAHYLREARDQFARRAYLRACEGKGWKVHRNGTGTELVRKGERITMPPDYLPAERLEAG